MKISLRWLETYFDAELPPEEELVKLFTFHFSEVESVEKKGDDTIFDLKILPDRAHYALSHKGVAHEISTLTGIPIKSRLMPETPATCSELPTISIVDGTLCRRMTARLFDNVTVTSSPEWLKTALESIGARSINTVVDLTNYVMYDIGQPSHAFDADKIQGGIVIRPALDGEKLVLLNEKEITLTPQDLVLSDDIGPLDIAGIKGGKRAEVTLDTKRILVTSGNFQPSYIRRSAFRHDLRNEASKRFENEITQELAISGMHNVSALINKLIPDAGLGPIVDVYPTKATKTTIPFNMGYLKERLGIDIPEQEVQDILTRLGVSYKDNALEIPYERLDLTIPEDIVEEVGRIHGYDAISGSLPPNTQKPVAILPEFFVTEKIKNILCDRGFSEVLLYSFVPKGDVEIAKPLASDKAYMRTRLTPGIEKCLERNVVNLDLLGLSSIRIFELGKVFTSKGEYLNLSFGVSQVKNKKGVQAIDVIKDTVDNLEKALSVQLHADIVAQGIYAIAECNLDSIIPLIKTSDSYSELEFKKIIATEYKPFSVYPFIVRDIAVFVDEGVTEEEVWSNIEQGIREGEALSWLVRHELFDVFKKEGRTSYAFRIVFQSKEQTLKDDEVASVMEKVYFQMAEKKWQVR